MPVRPASVSTSLSTALDESEASGVYRRVPKAPGNDGDADELLETSSFSHHINEGNTQPGDEPAEAVMRGDLSILTHSICLHKKTQDALRSLHSSSPVFSVAFCVGGVLVGVALRKEVPKGVVLPSGVEWKSVDGVTVGDVLALCEKAVKLPNLVALRYCASHVLNGGQAASLIDEDEVLLTVDDKVFSSDGEGDGDGDHVDLTIGDITKKRGTLNIAHIGLYGAAVQKSPDDDGDVDRPSAPVLVPVFDDNGVSVLRVDVLAYVPLEASRTDVLKAINTSISRIASSRACLEGGDGKSVSWGHFNVMGGDICVTILSEYLDDVEGENSLQSVASRTLIHETLALPMNRRLLRKNNRLFGRGGGDASRAGHVFDGGWRGRLSDVHIGIKGHGLSGSDVSTHLVDGSYLYCHYLQDKKNDSGWGCAYRSLQTLVSWCVNEGYCNLPDSNKLPTHLDIQQALVSVGDKPATFVASTEWIGANEVCYALQQLTGVESKILHVSSGSEMEGKARELALHFDDVGSPVMVGGGVLAWTILGVVWNERTGVAKFLILDPHYEGKDDLATIQRKGWVAWKKADIFKEGAFYNLCMPQRLTMV